MALNVKPKTSMVLSIFFLFALGSPVFAQRTVDFITRLNSSGQSWGITIIGYQGIEREVVIPGTIDAKPVTVIGDRAFCQANLSSVVIPDTVVSIGEQAFYGNNLKWVVMSVNIKKIAVDAFDSTVMSQLAIEGYRTPTVESYRAPVIESYRAPTVESYRIPTREYAGVPTKTTIVVSGKTNSYVTANPKPVTPDPFNPVVAYDSDYWNPAANNNYGSTFYSPHNNGAVSIIAPPTVVSGVTSFPSAPAPAYTVPSAIAGLPSTITTVRTSSPIPATPAPAQITTIRPESHTGTVLGYTPQYEPYYSPGYNPLQSPYPANYGGQTLSWDFDSDRSPYEGANVEFIVAVKNNRNGATATLVGYNGKSTEVEIPSLVENARIIEIGKTAFAGKYLTDVYIPESVAIIGDAAFSANQLTSIELPGSVLTIGYQAFAGNMLTSIVIGTDVSLADDSFNNGFAKVYVDNSRRGGLYTLTQNRWGFRGELRPSALQPYR
jgi:hypothetical protein